MTAKPKWWRGDFAASLFGVFAVGACAQSIMATGPAQSERSPTGIQLERLWSISGFNMPEGAAQAPDGGYFISNIAGKATDKNGAGWISKLTADGRIEAMRWVDGLDAPKGLVVVENQLYVADIDRVMVFDAVSGARLNEVPVAGAAFLNDMTVWRGQVLVSDSATSAVYVIADDTSSILVSTPAYTGLNGLLEGPDGDLLITSMGAGALLSFDGSGSVRLVAEGLDNPDGIGRTLSDAILVSSWPGQVFEVSMQGDTSELLDTRNIGILQNDLSIFGDTVIVPNLRPGTVTAWRVTCEC